MDNRILKSILILTVIVPFVAFAELNGDSGGYEYVETGHPSDTLSRTYNAAASLPYGEGEIFAWEDIEPSDEPSCGNAKSNERFFDSVIIKNAKFRAKRVASRVTDEIAYKDITLSAPGTLASALGDDINEIDSLVVRGPINAADFHTIWSSSFYGGLTVANLEYAQIADNRIPKNAFWYQSEQYTPGSEYIDCILLRRIILPEGVVEIGEGAFCYAINLENINFPSSLRAINKRCFSDCISLNVNPLIIPEGVEEIGYMAFVNCKSLTGKIILPTTLKKINDSAFFSAKITECNFPEGLEEIGDGAFYATRLREAILPNSCQSFPGGDHFALNYELEKIRFPDNMKLIPNSFVDNCIVLKEFIIENPNTIEEIGDRAFWQCGALQGLPLFSNLKTISTYGLSGPAHEI